MTNHQITEYQHDKNFQRNETIWVLKTIDHKSSAEIAKLFSVSADAVDLIVQLHQLFWDETT
jgi:hypothetical protein